MSRVSSFNQVNSDQIKTLLTTAIQRLVEAGCESPRLDAEVLLAHILGRERAWLYTHPTETLPSLEVTQFLDLIARREQREPVAYLIGHKAFFGLDFQVNRHVLIPRPETELVVERAIAWANERMANGECNTQYAIRTTHQREASPWDVPQMLESINQSKIQNLKSKITITDVGTGSGCLAVTLAKHLPEAVISAVDISQEALAVARRNAVQHGVAHQINFQQGNLLEPVAGPFDLIVSNPPYVSPEALATTAPEVQRYEPRRALEGGAEGVEIIEQLLTQAQSKLAPAGCILIEIGAGQGQRVKSLAQLYFPQATISIEKDLAGLDRLLVIDRLTV